MTWHLTTDAGEGGTTEYETGDEAVDALMHAVRQALDSDAQVGPATAALWRDDATTALLKRYLDGTEGMGGDMEGPPTNSLHVSIGHRDFYLMEVSA